MKLLRALSTVSGMTLLSRITGLVRESLKAAMFGAGVQMDAFEGRSGCRTSCAACSPRVPSRRRSSRSSPNTGASAAPRKPGR
jgi:hypothetical protein